jgi:hypothetical protein
VFLYALIVLCRVQGEFREDFRGGRVQDDGVRFLGEDQDGGGPADADVPEVTGEAKADSSSDVDAVGAGTEVRPVGAGARGAALGVAAYASAGVRRFRASSGVRGCRCAGISGAGH